MADALAPRSGPDTKSRTEKRPGMIGRADGMTGRTTVALSGCGVTNAGIGSPGSTVVQARMSTSESPRRNSPRVDRSAGVASLVPQDPSSQSSFRHFVHGPVRQVHVLPTDRFHQAFPLARIPRGGSTSWQRGICPPPRAVRQGRFRLRGSTPLGGEFPGGNNRTGIAHPADGTSGTGVNRLAARPRLTDRL